MYHYHYYLYIDIISFDLYVYNDIINVVVMEMGSIFGYSYTYHKTYLIKHLNQI